MCQIFFSNGVNSYTYKSDVPRVLLTTNEITTNNFKFDSFKMYKIKDKELRFLVLDTLFPSFRVISCNELRDIALECIIENNVKTQEGVESFIKSKKPWGSINKLFSQNR